MCRPHARQTRCGTLGASFGTFVSQCPGSGCSWGASSMSKREQRLSVHVTHWCGRVYARCWPLARVERKLPLVESELPVIESKRASHVLSDAPYSTHLDTAHRSAAPPRGRIRKGCAGRFRGVGGGTRGARGRDEGWRRLGDLLDLSLVPAQNPLTRYAQRLFCGQGDAELGRRHAEDVLDV